MFIQKYFIAKKKKERDGQQTSRTGVLWGGTESVNNRDEKNIINIKGGVEKSAIIE